MEHRDALNRIFPASLRAQRSNPEFCFPVHFWIATSLRSFHEPLLFPAHGKILEAMDAAAPQVALPDKPNSRLQCYRLTRKGREFAEADGSNR